MKKMSKANGNIIVEEAASTFSGISFRIVKRIDNLFEVGKGEFFTEKDENGNIVTKEGSAEEKFIENRGEKKNHKKQIVIIILSTLMFAALVVIRTTRTLEVVTGIFLFGMGLLMISEQLEIFILAKTGNKKYQSFRRYHAAEHAVINAYYDLHRPPNLLEIRNYSNWSYRCGSLVKQRSAMPYLTIGLCRLLVPGTKALPITIIVSILMIYLVKKEKINFLQFLVTSTPKQEEYLVAIEGLNSSLQMLEEIDEDEVRKMAKDAEMFTSLFLDWLTEANEDCENCPDKDSCPKYKFNN